MLSKKLDVVRCWFCVLSVVKFRMTLLIWNKLHARSTHKTPCFSDSLGGQRTDHFGNILVEHKGNKATEWDHWNVGTSSSFCSWDFSFSLNRHYKLGMLQSVQSEWPAVKKSVDAGLREYESVPWN